MCDYQWWKDVQRVTVRLLKPEHPYHEFLAVRLPSIFSTGVDQTDNTDVIVLLELSRGQDGK